MSTQFQFGGLLNDNIYANNVNKKMSLMNNDQLALPQFSNSTVQQPVVNNKQGLFSKLIFGNNAPPVAQPISQNNNQNGNMNAEQVRAFLEQIPEQDRLIASMNPKKYMEERIKMQAGNRTLTTEQKNIQRYLSDPEYAKAYDERQGLDPEFQAKLELAQRLGEKGIDYDQFTNELGASSYTVLDEKRDNLYATVVNEFYDKGGYAVQNTNIERLVETIGKITKDPSTTGIIQGVLPNELLAMLGYGEAIQTKEAVASIVYQTLRATLGAQFTEKEGQRLISASFNPLLSAEQNARRLNLMLKEILAVTTSKQERIRHVEKYGTLKGFKGEMPAFDQWKDDPDAMLQAIQAESYDIVSSFISVDDYAGMTTKELKQYIASLDPDVDNYERQYIQSNLSKIQKQLNYEE
jgi:hypothetical protein